MAADRYFPYDRSGSAKAFIEGVRFVNDSSLVIQGLFWVPGPRGRENSDAMYVVHIIDTDKESSESEKKPKRWTQACEMDID
jgi:hypothetical protein